MLQLVQCWQANTLTKGIWVCYNFGYNISKKILKMNINTTHRLFLRDIYSYDITACHYIILKKHNIDITNLERDNKKIRNTQIGKMMRDNSRITSLLRNITNSLIDEYIMVNDIKNDEIILRQYDGIITSKVLSVTNLNNMPLEYRHHFEVFISSFNKKMYLAKASNSDIIIKGVPFRYKLMDEVYEQICKINYANKTAIFKSLQRIKDNFIRNRNPNLFGIPVNDTNVNIFLKEYGEIEISKSALRILDINDIDREQYFKFYIEPFVKSIVSEFIK